MTAALVLLKNFRSSKANNNNNNNRHGSGSNRITVDDANEADTGVACVQAKKNQCFICGKINHHAKNCRSVRPKI